MEAIIAFYNVILTTFELEAAQYTFYFFEFWNTFSTWASFAIVEGNRGLGFGSVTSLGGLISVVGVDT